MFHLLIQAAHGGAVESEGKVKLPPVLEMRSHLPLDLPRDSGTHSRSQQAEWNPRVLCTLVLTWDLGWLRTQVGTFRDCWRPMF